MDTAELARLVVRLIGDASSYTAMLTQVQASTKQVAAIVATAVSKIQGMESALKGVASGALGALAGLGLAGSFTAAFHKFEQFEQTIIGLDAAIKANGGNVEEVRLKYDEFAKTMGDLVGITKIGTLRLLEQVEAQGFSGDAAKQVATNAIALAKGNEELASSYVRVAVMMQRGHPEFARRILGLQGVKNGTELLTAIQKRLQTNMDIGIARGASLSKEMDKLKRSFLDVTLEIGKQVAEIIGPFVAALKLAVDWFKTLSPETKKTVTLIVMATMAFLALGPALSIAIAAFGPLVTLIISFGSAIIAAVTSPVGLFIAGIAAMVAVMLYFTGQGGELISWFGKQWDGLVEDVKIAVGGIGDAIKAGDIELAWKIVWASIRLIWAKSTQDLKEMWIAFKTWFKESAIEVGSYLEEAGRKANRAIVDSIANAWEKLGIVTKEVAEQIREANANNFGQEIRALDADKKKMLKDAQAQGLAEMKAIQDEINALKKERDGFVKEAREKAKDIKLPEFKVPKLPPMKQDVKLIPKFDAAAFESAEAITRIQAFKDKLEIQLQQKEGDLPGAMKKFDAAEAGGAEARSRNEGAETILKEIRDILKGDAKKPGIPLVPAGLGI